MGADDETGSSSSYASLDHFDLHPEIIKRGMSRTSSLRIDSQPEHDHTGNDTRFPIIRIGSSSSESSTESDVSSSFDIGTHDRSYRSCLSPGVVSPRPVINDKPELPPTQFPPIQIMQKSEGYEQDRIPSSVFLLRNSSDALVSDWSMNSNDSLFSINVGNGHSFSKEKEAVINSETITEVSKSQELFSFTPPRSENPESPSSPTAFPASPIVELAQEQKADKEGETAPTIENGKKPGDERPKKVPTVSWKSSATYSEKSQTSSNSFAFPLVYSLVLLNTMCN
ncbi:hypothetical protein LINPERHAP1_LOCUS35559 [Linum perenne]